MTCERCRARPATACAIDLPDALPCLPGVKADQVLGWVLCDDCLEATERDGKWDEAQPLEAAA